MSSPLYIHEEAILPFTPAADQTGNEGYLVDLAAGVATVSTSATTAAKGVILEGAATTGKSSVGILGTLKGTVPMKASGIIAQNARVQQAADGTIVTEGAGARVVVGIACESAVSGDIIEVAPLMPTNLT